ncbi:MAG: 3-dehydroquinate synthase family protein [Actinomycetota bacterium]|nr:3-dehydroquinate synthase family protein [Actinomycetota bacterium]
MRRHVIWRSDEPVSTIIVGRGVNNVLADIVHSHSYERVVILCQPPTSRLAETYANVLADVGIAVSGYTLPDGEDAKQLGIVEDVYRFLNETGFTRDDLIIGVGGGSLTDVAGFVGGTYLRGVAVVYVATSLLGAVDASIGGKTGVNLDGKNLVGVFAHPLTVLIDIDIIDELSPVMKRAGAAEALKTGFIEDMRIVEAYEAGGLDVDLLEIVNRSVAVKVGIVTEDFKERGRRAILNYGHTVGHAIETTTGRSHGESVAIGMVAEGAASSAYFGFTGEERQRAVLEQVGLPTRAADAGEVTIRAQMALDKKRDAGGLRMILLEDFGSPKVVHADDATVQAALDAVGIT